MRTIRSKVSFGHSLKMQYIPQRGEDQNVRAQGANEIGNEVRVAIGKRDKEETRRTCVMDIILVRRLVSLVVNDQDDADGGTTDGSGSYGDPALWRGNTSRYSQPCTCNTSSGKVERLQPDQS